MTGMGIAAEAREAVVKATESGGVTDPDLSAVNNEEGDDGISMAWSSSSGGITYSPLRSYLSSTIAEAMDRRSRVCAALKWW
jgi:hypothetical protein